MRHLGVAGRVPLHRVHTQPVRHIHRQVFRHHQTAAVLQEKEIEKIGVAHDPGRLAGIVGHHVRTALRMVRIAHAEFTDKFVSVRSLGYFENVELH